MVGKLQFTVIIEHPVVKGYTWPMEKKRLDKFWYTFMFRFLANFKKDVQFSKKRIYM